MSSSGFKRRDWASGRSAGAPLAERGYTAGRQSTRVQHREFIGNVFSGAAQTFNLVSPSGSSINPGTATVFPWLSKVASNFIEYKINSMAFHYVSTSGEFTSGSSGNAALGSVNMCVQYNATVTPYTSKAQMLNEEGAVSVVPSRDAVLHVKVQPQSVLKRQYVRGPGASAQYDPLMYDLGVIYVACDGNPTANIVLGEIWLDYDITLYKASLSLGNTTNTVYAASGHIPPGYDANLQQRWGVSTSSGAVWGGPSANTVVSVNNMPPQARPITGANAFVPATTGGVGLGGSPARGGVSADGKTVLISAGTLRADEVLQIVLNWGPYGPKAETITGAAIATVTAVPSADWPYVIGDWGDWCWQISNGVCLNCATIKVQGAFPVTGGGTSTNQTTIYLAVTDTTQDCLFQMKLNDVSAQTYDKVLIPYVNTFASTVLDMAWAIIMNIVKKDAAATTFYPYTPLA